MMIKTHRLYAPTRALPAIAAALALSSTPALARAADQQTQAAPTATVPADQPAPASDSSATAPVSSDTSTQTSTTIKRTIKHRTHAAATNAQPVARRTTVRTATSQASVPVAKKAATPKALQPAPAAPQSAVAPLISYQPKPAPPEPRSASAKPLKLDQQTLEIAGGVLALLILGAAAAAVMSRRRRRREQELADAQTMSYEPFETPTASEARPEPIVEPAAVQAGSAFAWGNQSDSREPADGQRVAEQDDRRPGETWVERAYRGPTPNNPSVSLRNRLKRAAFFDKREREAAAGLAAPVDARAGLPGAMAGERELA